MLGLMLDVVYQQRMQHILVTNEGSTAGDQGKYKHASKQGRKELKTREVVFYCEHAEDRWHVWAENKGSVTEWEQVKSNIDRRRKGQLCRQISALKTQLPLSCSYSLGT